MHTYITLDSIDLQVADEILNFSTEYLYNLEVSTLLFVIYYVFYVSYFIQTLKRNIINVLQNLNTRNGLFISTSLFVRNLNQYLIKTEHITTIMLWPSTIQNDIPSTFHHITTPLHFYFKFQTWKLFLFHVTFSNLKCCNACGKQFNEFLLLK